MGPGTRGRGQSLSPTWLPHSPLRAPPLRPGRFRVKGTHLPAERGSGHRPLQEGQQASAGAMLATPSSGRSNNAAGKET